MLCRYSLLGKIMKAISDWREFHRDIRYLRTWISGVNNADCSLGHVGNMTTLILIEAVSTGASGLDIILCSDYTVPSIRFVFKNGSEINSKIRPGDVRDIAERILFLAGITDKYFDNPVDQRITAADLPIKILDNSYLLKITYFHPSFDDYAEIAKNLLNEEHEGEINDNSEKVVIEIFRECVKCP